MFRARGMATVSKGAGSVRTLSWISVLLRCRAPRMKCQPARFDRGDGFPADHAAVGDDADGTEPETLLQPRRDPVQGFDVSGVSGPNFRSYGFPIAVEHHADDQLLALRPEVLALAVAAQFLPTLAVEVERGGVEEHHVEVGVEVPAFEEQFLLDPVLGAAGRELPFRRVLPRQRGPEPGHGPVELVQFQSRRPRDRLVPHPPAGLPVRARDHDPVQHAGEHGPFHVEAEASAPKRRTQDLGAAGGVPQRAEQQRRTQGAPLHLRVSGAAVGLRQRQQGFGIAAGGLDQPIQPPGGGEAVDPAQGCDDALTGSAVGAVAFDDLQVGETLDGLGTTEHVAARLIVSITALDHNIGIMSSDIWHYRAIYQPLFGSTLWDKDSLRYALGPVHA